jgi:hypothetical protein
MRQLAFLWASRFIYGGGLPIDQEEDHPYLSNILRSPSPCWLTWLKPVMRLFCKRPILCLASSKILTPPPTPLTAQVWGRVEDTLVGWRGGGWGVNILEDARHSSVLYICKYFVVKPVPSTQGEGRLKKWEGRLLCNIIL